MKLVTTIQLMAIWLFRFARLAYKAASVWDFRADSPKDLHDMFMGSVLRYEYLETEAIKNRVCDLWTRKRKD